MHPKLLGLVSFVACAVLSGCSIARTVQTVRPTTRIHKIYVTQSRDIDMAAFIPEVVHQLQELGYEAQAFPDKDYPPAGAVHVLKVTADWRWDMAVYLSRFTARLYEKTELIGAIDYSTEHGGASFGKFGHTAEKIRPLLAEMLKTAQRVGPPPKAAATTMGTAR